MWNRPAWVSMCLLGICVITAAVVFIADAWGHETAVLSHDEMSSLRGTTATCGCDLDPKSDCDKANEVCPCAQTVQPAEPPWLDPVCGGKKKRYFGHRNECKDGDKTKHCHSATIKCWIEYFCTADGEPQVYRKCVENQPQCQSGPSTIKCINCTYGNPTDTKPPGTVHEECVAN